MPRGFGNDKGDDSVQGLCEGISKGLKTGSGKMMKNG